MEITLEDLRAYCIGQGDRVYIDEGGGIWCAKPGEVSSPISVAELRELVAASQGVQVADWPEVRLQPRENAIYLQAEGYEALALVLQRAFIQAAHGKGKERHAQGEPFTRQVMQDGARRFGVGSLLFQAFKKSEESQRLPHDKAVAELLGAIVYLAGAVIAMEQKDGHKPPAANDNAPCCNGGTQSPARCIGCAEACGLAAEKAHRG